MNRIPQSDLDLRLQQLVEDIFDPDVPKPEEVLPCPFCGSKHLIVENDGNEYYYITCKCSNIGPSGSTRREAIEKWNTRTTPPTPC